MRDEIIRAIVEVSDYANNINDESTHVEGSAEEMADKIMTVLGCTGDTPA